MLACPFCGEANPDDAAACLNCQRDLRGQTKRPEGWEQTERSRRRAYKSTFISLGISGGLSLAIGEGLVLVPSDFDLTKNIAIGLIVGFLLAALLMMGLGLRAAGAISASRRLHRKHGVRPVPPAGVYLLPVMSILIAVPWLILGGSGVVLLSIPRQRVSVLVPRSRV